MPINIPNSITLLRIVLIPFFVGFMIYGYSGAALIVFAVACISDALDGMIARLTNTMTELGAFLDPTADKLLIVSAFITLAAQGLLPIWLVIIVVSRDIILVLGSLVLYFTGNTFVAKPSMIGKMTTVLQLAAVSLALVLQYRDATSLVLAPLEWLAAAFTIASGAQYVIRGARLANTHAT